MELLATVTIPEYIRVLKTTESRRATYYKEGEKIPMKYQNTMGKDCHWMFIAKKKGKYLVDADGDLIVKNINSQGTPRYKIINGQDLHALTLQDYERAKIVSAIKEQMVPHIEKLDVITKYPLRILCELHDTYMDMVHVKTDGTPKIVDWDVDNRGLFYCKTFPDVLSGSPKIMPKLDEVGNPILDKKDKPMKELVFLSKRIIPNDHRKFITQPPVALFTPIERTEDRKLVFKIFHDDREIIKNHMDYQDFG